MMLMPNNVLAQKNGGTPSGSNKTGLNNTLGGEIGGYHDWFTTVSHPLIEDGELSLDFAECFQHMVQNWEHGRAGDDEIESFSDEVAHLYTVERVTACTAARGFRYPPEKIIDSRDLSDLTFLGSKFYFHPTYHRWLPLFDGDKALHSAQWYESRTSIHQDLYRCLALRAEAFWDLQARMKFNFIRDYLTARGAVPRPTRKLTLPQEQIEVLLDPTDRKLISLYLGLEAGSKKSVVIRRPFFHTRVFSNAQGTDQATTEGFQQEEAFCCSQCHFDPISHLLSQLPCTCQECSTSTASSFGKAEQQSNQGQQRAQCAEGEGSQRCTTFNSQHPRTFGFWPLG